MRMKAFGDDFRLPYGALKEKYLPTFGYHDGVEKKEFKVNNWIESRIRVYKGYYRPDTGEPCTLIVYDTSKGFPNENCAYYVDVLYESLNLLEDVLNLLREIDNTAFKDVGKGESCGE